MRKRYLLLALLALPLCGCEEDFCEASVEDPLSALLVGFIACQGRNTSDNEPPTASFTMTPDAVTSGETVRFDASASADPRGGIIRYEWDLDGLRVGDSGFELDKEQVSTFDRAILSSAPTGERRSIALRVTDSVGATAVAARTLAISPANTLSAAFTISPSPAFVGQPVTFDASGSSGATVYGWDFEGDGSFEERLVASSATHVYTTPGERVVRLIVKNLLGQSAEAAMTLNVRSAGAAQGADAVAVGRAAARATGRRFRARLTGVSFPADLGAGVRRGGVVAYRGVRSSGRLEAGGRRLGALRRFRAASWVARLNLSADLRSRDVSVRGLVLATFPRSRGRACLRIALGGRAGRRTSGRLTVLGGSGPASRLAGRARYRHSFVDGELRLRGRVRSRARSPRPVPLACSRLR